LAYYTFIEFTRADTVVPWTFNITLHMLDREFIIVVLFLHERTVYDISFKHIFHLGKIPRHGNARRFGCAIGAVLYISSGIGFFIENMYLAYIPSLVIISLAFIAAVTQWCFASTLYNFLFRKNETCCAEDN